MTNYEPTDPPDDTDDERFDPFEPGAFDDEMYDRMREAQVEAYFERTPT